MDTREDKSQAEERTSVEGVEGICSLFQEVNGVRLRRQL